jgi:glycosyltransferase involved in cell wall biosynthesis
VKTPRIFICYASEDKETVARPLFEAFRKHGYECWFDEEALAWGQSTVIAINKAIGSATHVVVILSASFAVKHYANAELAAFLHREASDGGDMLLPLVVGDSSDLLKTFPMLRDRQHVSWSGSVDEVVRAFRGKVARTIGKSGVCMISSEYPPVVHGGLGSHVAALSAALGAFITVDIVLPDAGRKYSSTSAHVRPIAIPKVQASYDHPESWLRFANSVAQKLADKPPSIIHCHDWVTVLGAVKCRFSLKIPFVYHVHLPNVTPLCASIENLGLVCADCVTVNSEAVRQELLDRHLPIRAIEVVPNGVDTSMYFPAESWPADSSYVLFVGRLVEQKGVEYLLRAFTYVAEKFPRVKLKIVGRGEYSDALERLAKNLSIADRVEFVGWVGDSAERRRLYQHATLLAVPSVYEPFGMTALEAMACKRPLVASDTGGLKEIVEDGATGLLATPKDHLELAQCIMTLLADDALRAQMGEKALARAQSDDYHWSSIARYYVELYERVLQDDADFSVTPELEDLIRPFKDQIANELKHDRSMEWVQYELFDLKGKRPRYAR